MPLQIETQPFQFNSNVTALSTLNASCIQAAGNQTVFSDGLSANAIGNGPQTLSINYSNGVYIGGSGEVHATTYYGDGSHLTGVITVYTNGTGTNSIIPVVNNNTSTGTGSNIGGGANNTIGSVTYGVIAGGASNVLNGGYTPAIGGGEGNVVNNTHAVIAGGCQNTVSGDYSAIVGGEVNTINSNYEHSFIGGGYANTVSNYRGVIVGGDNNLVNGDHGAIVGGSTNTAGGLRSFVGAGCTNVASGQDSSILGGANNQATAQGATVGGGCCNVSSGIFSVVDGGCCNTASSCYAVVGGGLCNTSNICYATIGGGWCNTASGFYATVTGGACNQSNNYFASVVGGCCNTASGLYAVVANGVCNVSSGNCSFVGGGCFNIASQGYSTVAGGGNNKSSDTCTTIGGGGSNCAIGNASVVAGGELNCAYSDHGTVAGGKQNCAGYYSFTGGGYNNSVSGNYSGILGGLNNVNNQACSFIIGQGITASRPNFTYVNNLSSLGQIYSSGNGLTPYGGMRNRIINGDFYIDQRKSGASSTPSGTSNVIDRWKYNVNGAPASKIKVGQSLNGVASPVGFTSYYGLSVITTNTPAAGDYVFLSQVIEGPNTIDLYYGGAQAVPAYLSFYVYASITGNYGGFVRNYGSFNRSYTFAYNVPVANTWTYISLPIKGDTAGSWFTDSSHGIEVGFEIANGSTYQTASGSWTAGNYTGPTGTLVNMMGTAGSKFYITGVQFEPGIVATPYEKRNYGIEYAMCQRYYEILELRVGGYHTTGNNLRGSAVFKTTKRPSSLNATIISTDETANLGSLTIDNSNYRYDSARYLVPITSTGDAYGQWQVSFDSEF